MCGDSAARERYLRAGIGVLFGQMRDSLCLAGDSRGHRLAPVENLDVNPLPRHAHLRHLFHVRHEASRPTKVDIRISWDPDLIETDRDRWPVASKCSPILSRRGRAAEANEAASVGERAHNAADFRGEWTMLPVAYRVDPEDLPCRAALG